MQYCTKSVVLPSPMNLIDMGLTLPCKSWSAASLLCCTCCCDNSDSVEAGSGRLQDDKYDDLMRRLASKYADDFEVEDPDSALRDQLERMARDLRKERECIRPRIG